MLFDLEMIPRLSSVKNLILGYSYSHKLYFSSHCTLNTLDAKNTLPLLNENGNGVSSRLKQACKFF